MLYDDDDDYNDDDDDAGKAYFSDKTASRRQYKIRIQHCQ